MMTAVLDLLFPPRCAFCGKILDASEGVCGECRTSLPFRAEGKILRTVGENCYPCAVAMYYDRPVSTGIKALKFGRKSWRAKVFARYLAPAVEAALSGQFDAVTFVPVSRKRNFSRGFDQARLLAQETAKLWGVKAESTLRKVRHNRAQSSITSPTQRAANVKGAYAVPHPNRVRGRRFLLIDDVCTTGSTISAAADALMNAGAAGVVCAALAGGHQRRHSTEKPSDFQKICERKYQE